MHTSTGGQGATGGQLLPLCWPDTPGGKPPGPPPRPPEATFNPQALPTHPILTAWVLSGSGLAQCGVVLQGAGVPSLC